MKRLKVKRRNSMAQNWDYAELSKAAKAAGGPEKYVEMLELVSKEAGKMEMLPWLGVAAVGASLLTAATIKVVDYFKSRKKNNETEIEKAKAEIINGIKEYDAAHPDEKEQKKKKQEQARKALLKQQEEQKAIRQKEITDSILQQKRKNDIQNGF